MYSARHAKLAAEAAARAEQDREYQAAIKRILNQVASEPLWNRPTDVYPSAQPLMTPGQQARSRER